jgi:hypothetical protein
MLHSFDLHWLKPFILADFLGAGDPEIDGVEA